MVKNLPTNAEDMGLIPGLVRFPGEGNVYRLEYCLGNPKDKAAWWSTVDCWEPLWEVPPVTRSRRKYWAGKAVRDPIHDEVMRKKT